MKKHLLVMMVIGLASSMETSGVLAGGSSDTSGEGCHCYQFFSLPDGKFAQTMTNADDPEEVNEKVGEFIKKYVDEEGGVLSLAAGNVNSCMCPTVKEPPKDQPPKKEKEIFVHEDGVIFKGKTRCVDVIEKDLVCNAK